MKLIKKNFLVINLLIFAVVTIILGILYFIMPIYYEKVKTQEIKQEFSKVSRRIEGKSLSQVSKVLTQNTKSDVWYTLVDQKNHMIFPRLQISSDEDTSDIIIEKDVNPQNEVMKHTFALKSGEKVTLWGELSLQPVSDASKVLLNLYPYLLLMSLTIGSIVAFLYSKTSSSRLLKISKTTRKMADLETNLSCDVKGKDEIANLASDINRLYDKLFTTIKSLNKEYDKLADLERSKSEFLRMTSHELKTPISSVIGMIDGMLYNVGDFANRDKYLRKSRKVLEGQAQVIQTILSLSKLENGVAQHQEVFSLKNALEEEMEVYHILSELDGYQVTIELEEQLVRANKMYLLKAIKNIIDNAFRYTKPHGQIVIGLKDNQLSIKNEAEILLSKEQLDQLFQPFYRPDYSRSRKDGGTGLGLFIAHQVFERYHFDYHMEIEDKRWVAFTVTFPNLKSGLTSSFTE
ncbi:HAMP domain-containing sensor histidine kinase [Streptococcus thoraltensis]|uniref:HAMP domain-containing sensor histidine kinase n=1 Tax=Streptococcus thoraltensis TaxID=55085 RepID=UPI001F56730E|nr:ATP-binding protein [Streptococcus thoraltensis]